MGQKTLQERTDDPKLPHVVSVTAADAYSLDDLGRMLARIMRGRAGAESYQDLMGTILLRLVDLVDGGEKGKKLK